MIAFNRESPPGDNRAGAAGWQQPGSYLQPEARYLLDSYLLKLCQQLHQALLEIRDHLVCETETQVLQLLKEGSPEQVRAILDRLGEPQGYAARLVKELYAGKA